LTEEKIKELLLSKKWSYVVDAIDSITPKLTLLSTCYYNKIPIIASMGAGGKMDPTKVEVKELFKTYNCNLAHYIRKRLKKYGIKKGIKAVFSPELSKKDSLMLTDGANFKKSAFGTISYLPAVFGLTCASVVIREIVNWKPQK
jgi:tRNA A37 threonylcarbamoyladenosine dehydratase